MLEGILFNFITLGFAAESDLVPSTAFYLSRLIQFDAFGN